jgi:CheY-like chemotaxis protein
VKADPSQIENSLLNLCINARDAMPRGGLLTIETANRWLDEASARQLELTAGQYVALSVSDTGTGMTPETVAKAFDPFFTTKPIGQGTGLGLSMVYGFARQSGGQARIYSELGQGSTVTIYLPRHVAGDGAPVAEAPAAAAPRAGGVAAHHTVLLVDDEVALRGLVADSLREDGFTILEAGSAPSALASLRSDASIDLLVTDVGLPGGMNGRQMADAARTTRRELKVLFITGYAENAVLGNGHLDRGMDILTKPFEIAQLTAKVRAILDRG